MTTEFFHRTFIRATPEAVWDGLVQPDATRRYWMHENRSDWQPGSRWQHVACDAAGTVDIEGEVLAAEPGAVLELGWEDPRGVHETSRVRIELAPQPGWPGGDWTELKLTHAELVPDSEMHRSISWGWPAVCAGLKTWLECGDLPDPGGPGDD